MKAKNIIDEQKTNTFELNKKTSDKAKNILAGMLEEFQKQPPKNPAEELIKQNIELIDELTRKKVSLPLIYERLNSALGLGISAASFGVYVRRVRKEVGSKLAPKKRTKKEQNTNTEQTQSEQIIGFQCDRCATDSIIIKSKTGDDFYKCQHCETIYFTDDANNITQKVAKLGNKISSK